MSNGMVFYIPAAKLSVPCNEKVTVLKNIVLNVVLKFN